MTIVLHISDPHFGTERPTVMEALVRLRHEQAPDVLIMSGDITQRARRKQFAAARAFVERLGVANTLVIPGNHDIPLFNVLARLFHPYANHRREFGADLEPSFESEELLIITVNTTRPYRHKDGEVSRQQMEGVARRLERAATEQLRVVVVHQPVAVLREEDACNLLHGHEWVVREWVRAGVDLILGGHIHLPYTAVLHEQLTDLPRRAWVVQAGTAISWRIRHEADNSTNVIRYHEPGRVIVERWDYSEGQQRFWPVHSEALTLSRD